MHRKRSISAVFGVCCLGLMVWLSGAAIGPASGQTNAPKVARVTVVTVTVGKPTELAFKLSKFSALPAGTITFKVKNAGLGAHDFKICTTPITSATKNSCVGKTTKRLKSGESATLTVTLTKSGKYEFLCSVPGHAGAGMKGLLGVGVTVTPSASVAGSTNTGSSSSSATAGAGGGATAGAGGGTAGECPAGTTIATAGAENDGDPDDVGGPTDGDGCL